MKAKNEAPKIGEIYSHFKGDIYRIIEQPTDSTDGKPIKIYGYAGETIVWYQCLHSEDKAKIGRVFTRTLSEFVESVEVDGAVKPRFFFLDINSESLREALAQLEHIQWAHWTTYMLANPTAENVGRWHRQIETPYDRLTEEEKDKDRAWADKVLELIKGA